MNKALRIHVFVYKIHFKHLGKCHLIKRFKILLFDGRTRLVFSVI